MKTAGSFPWKRINVVGTSGAGKSTFALQLSAMTQMPYIEIARVFWEPNWTSPPDDRFFARLAEAVKGDSWILDGNYFRSTPVKWRDVQAVIWLDYSFARTLYQVVKRTLQRGVSGKEIWEGSGNRESLRKSFLSRESIIWWSITTHKKMRIRYGQFMKDPNYSDVKFLRFTHPRQAEHFLKEIQNKLR